MGSRRGQDETALAGRGFPVTLLAGRGIVRRLRPRDLATDVVAIVELVTAAVAAYRLVQRLRPRVVVSVGGYASVAAVDGRRPPAGPAGAGQRRRRSRCRQPAVRSHGAGQRGGVAGDTAAAGRGHRHAGAPVHQRRGP